MKLDFWNNPILVSTLRTRLRSGFVLHALAFYPLFLLMIGAAVPLFYPKAAADMPYYGFVILMIMQFAGCGLVSTASTSHSMKSEVVNQTLDFLRLTPLTPWQILLGKLLGEVTVPFFVAVASFPVALVCWTAGGVDLFTLSLLYANLLVYVLLCGSAGLVMRLEFREDKRVDTVSLLALSGWFAALPILSALSLDLPGRLLVLLLLLPVMIGMAFFNLHVMARTLQSPLNPPVRRAFGYAIVLLLDILFAGAAAFLPREPAACAVFYWSAHLLVSAYLIQGVTPWREVLRTWCWRFRGSAAPLRDAWLGDRSGNGLAVLTAAMLGLLAYMLVFLPLAFAFDSRVELASNATGLWAIPLLSLMILLAYGYLFQWNSLIFGRSGNFVILLFVAGLVAPYYIGIIEEITWFSQLSPFAHYVHWMDNPSHGLLDLFPVVLIGLALVAFLARTSFAARMRYMNRVVDRKLGKMGVHGVTVER